MDKTIIIFDNQYITRTGLTAFFKQGYKKNDIQTINHKQGLVSALCIYPNAIVVIDYALSDLNSADALLNIAARFPDVHWILFSEELSMQFLKRITLNNNAFSIVLKHCEQEEVEWAVNNAVKDRQYICTQIAELLTERSDEINTQKEKLTFTEIEVLKEMVLGNSAKQIAQKRNASVHTIVTHRKNIYRKLQINTVQEASMYALRSGIVDMSDYSI